MPAFRNVPINRQSGRLGKHIPVTYDKDGWEVADHKGSVDHDMPVSSSSPISHSEHDSGSLEQDQNPDSYLFDSSDDVDATSSLPSRRNSHTRRRDPGHIPRPRNAFIFFRSSYISSARATGEGQQNELSKHAGKVWNKMSAEERRPFSVLAAIEKEEHNAKYPNYVYSPGRNGVKGKPKLANARKTGGATNASMKKRKASAVFEDNWSRSSDTSSEPPSPDSPLVPTLRLRPAKVPRAAAQRAVQRFVESPSPEPSARLSPISDEFHYPTFSTSAEHHIPATPPPLGFIPISEIPELEFTSMSVKEKSLKAEREPPSPFHPHLDTVTGQFAYQEYEHDFMSMPILPHTSAIYGGHEDMPSTTNLQTYSYAQASSSSLSNESYINYLPSGSDYKLNGNLDGDSMMQEYTNTDTGSNEYFDMNVDPDASIWQFFNFD